MYIYILLKLIKLNCIRAAEFYWYSTVTCDYWNV